MNRWSGIGRLTKDPVLATTKTDAKHVCSFTIAVRRNNKEKDGTYKADFVDCVAWQHNADFVCNNFRKGDRINILGSLTNHRWTDERGDGHSRMEVIVTEIEFVDLKKKEELTEMADPEEKLPWEQEEGLPY